MIFMGKQGSNFESLSIFHNSFSPEQFFYCCSAKRKPHAQYGLQIFPKTERKVWTKIVRQGQKNDQNLDFLISLKIDI